jgi:Glycosyltransferase family 87
MSSMLPASHNPWKNLVLLSPVLFIPIGSLWWLSRQPDLRLAVPEVIGGCALCVAALTLLAYCCERGLIRCPTLLILAVALLLRLFFVAGPPQLSDDLYRYLWDGRQLRQGVNPYAVAPAAASTTSGLETLRAKINHPELVTIYPPAAQLLFAAGSLFGGGASGFKLFLVLLDLLLCIVLLRLLSALQRPPWRLILYAWNPLPILEIASSGHIDGAALLLFLFAVLLLIRNSDGAREQTQASVPAAVFPGLAGGVFGAAVLVKLLPLFFLPALLLLCRRGRGFFLGGLSLCTLLLCLLFWPALANGLATLDLYLRNWEFAGFAFRLLRDLTSGGTARLLLAATFVLTAAALYLRAWRQNTASAIVPASYAVALAFLLLTTTLHPWYALCLAALLPLAGGPAGMALCWSVFLGYQVLIPYALLGQWQEQPWVAAAIVSAPVCALCGGWLAARWSRSGPRGR